MARQRDLIPSPRHHKGRAVVDCYIDGKRRTVTLGAWDAETDKPSAPAEEEFRKLATRLLVGKSPVVAPVPSGPADVNVAEALVRYTRHIDVYYCNPDGTPTGTAEDIKITLTYLKQMFAPLPLAEFDLKCFKAVRQRMIDDGRVRGQVNRRAGMVRAFIRWCVEEGLPVTPGVLEKLSAVKALAPGRDGVAEGEAREPADPAAVTKVLPLLRPPVAAIVQLLRLTGARPAEIAKLKPCEIDRSGDVWTITPTRHKGSWRGKSRVVYVGPEARTVLAPWLLRAPAPDAFVFSPARDADERNAARSANRQTPQYPSHMGRNAVKRKGATGQRRPRAFYSHLALSCAVRRACEKAKVKPFTPYQLRHLKAAELRERFGLEHVRAVLGHSFQAMSDHYSKAADKVLAVKAAATAG